MSVFPEQTEHRQAGAGPVIQDWRPEDPDFWDSRGRRIAQRNLWLSIPCLLLAFAVWMLFSVTAVKLPRAGFDFSTDQLFWFVALPSLSGATLRIFYSFVIPLAGGRRWTALSTLSLVLPALWLGLAVRDPGTPYGVFVAIAILCGLGGANFSSSMSNISFFFPKSRQGYALGMNAGLGNLGVSAAQFLVPLAIASCVFGVLGGAPQQDEDGALWLQNAGFIWVLPIVVCALAAWFGMNDLATARSSFAEQALIFRRKHNWLMCWLYVGTFGSFIGFSAGFPMLARTQFPAVDALSYAFLGPLVGALTRPLGGVLADRLGGARLSFWTFALMIAAVFAVLHFLPAAGRDGDFHGFLAAFLALFVLTGIGNGATFRMIPVIFRGLHARRSAGAGPDGQAEAMRQAGIESATVVGFAGAIGAYGGFFIPRSYGSSIAMTGGPQLALYVFIAFYASCLAITWWWYYRHGAEAPC